MLKQFGLERGLGVLDSCRDRLADAIGTVVSQHHHVKAKVKSLDLVQDLIGKLTLLASRCLHDQVRVMRPSSVSLGLIDRLQPLGVAEALDLV